MRRRWLFGPAALAIGWACTTVPSERTFADAPVNHCRTRDDCTTFGQGKSVECAPPGECHFNASLDYTLLIDVPETNAKQPSLSFAIRPARADSTNVACALPSCLALPQVFSVLGSYDVLSSEATKLGVDFGPGRSTSIPASVTLHPLMPASDDTLSFCDSVLRLQGSLDPRTPDPLTELDTRSPLLLGLPLESWRLDVARRYPSRADSSQGRTGPRRSGIDEDGGVPLFEHSAPVPLGDYLRAMYPAEPFADAMPPAFDCVTVDEQTLRQHVFQLGRSSTAVVISLPVSSPLPLEGWNASLVDDATGMRISPIRPIEGGRVGLSFLQRGRAQANTNPDQLKGVTFVVEPPAGAVALPTLRRAFVAEQFQPSTGVASLTKYPALPPPVRVSGLIEFDGTPREADIEFRSQAFSPRDDSGIRVVRNAEQTTQFSDVLTYTASARSDAEGRYALTLPPGTYDVLVRPLEIAANARAAITRSALVVDAVSVPLENRDVNLDARRNVRGRVTLADGRALASATVLAKPSSASRAQSDSGALPRPVGTVADANGEFLLALDAGVYDLSVRPLEGSGFPWLAISEVTVGSQDIRITEARLRVPAPVVVKTSLHDADDARVPRAVVRAFMVPTGRNVAVEIGEAITDSDGNFVLFLAEPR